MRKAGSGPGQVGYLGDEMRLPACLLTPAAALSIIIIIIGLVLFVVVVAAAAVLLLWWFFFFFLMFVIRRNLSVSCKAKEGASQPASQPASQSGALLLSFIHSFIHWSLSPQTSVVVVVAGLSSCNHRCYLLAVTGLDYYCTERW